MNRESVVKWLREASPQEMWNVIVDVTAEEGTEHSAAARVSLRWVQDWCTGMQPSDDWAKRALGKLQTVDAELKRMWNAYARGRAEGEERRQILRDMLAQAQRERDLRDPALLQSREPRHVWQGDDDLGMLPDDIVVHIRASDLRGLLDGDVVLSPRCEGCRAAIDEDEPHGYSEEDGCYTCKKCQDVLIAEGASA